MDMQAIDLPDASVDAVVSRFGYMLVPDPACALGESRRVLKQGAPLAFATWAPARRNPWATAYGPVLIERALQEPPRPDEPGQFALSEPDRIEKLSAPPDSTRSPSRRYLSSTGSRAGRTTVAS